MKKKRLQARDAKPSTQETKTQRLPIRLLITIAVMLIVITAAAYRQAPDGQFQTNYDDGIYVAQNPFLTHGINADSLKWALTTFRAANWHPVTWVSHMLDYRAYGLDPSGHHVTSVLLHILNTLLLFLMLAGMTRSPWKSALVAALFAIHPMHVESVAWIAERKDVLSAFFWLLTMLAYISYAKRPRATTYVLVILLCALAMMSKPMSVSLPIVLLLLDFWPLDRTRLRWQLLWEKIPLFAMSIGSCLLTMAAQGAAGAVVELQSLSVGDRIANALVAYVEYIIKMLWPHNMAAFYPHPDVIPAWQIAGAAVVLCGITILALRTRKQRPYLAFGWLWYLITLVPVIGLVQVGSQSMADRYSYLPYAGLFIMLAWGLSDLVDRRAQSYRMAMPVIAAAAIVACCILTYKQVSYWHDSRMLFQHAADVTQRNYLAYSRLSIYYENEEQMDRALDYANRCVDISPDFSEGRLCLGRVLVKMGRIDEGMDNLHKAVRLGENSAEVHQSLAFGYYGQGQVEAAIQECHSALDIDSTYSPSENMLAVIYFKQGKIDNAISLWQSALEHDQTNSSPHENLAVAYYTKRDYASAWNEVRLYREAGNTPGPNLIAVLSAKMPEPK